MAIDFDEALDAPEPELSSGMNITPLIDVLLVLLVMFIITIPIQLHSVNMEMPAGLPPPLSKPPLIVRIQVTAQNQFLWNDEPLADRANLEQHLQAAAQLAEQPEIHIRSHPLAKYDTVAAVLSASQRVGLQKIGVVGLESYAR
jgi:biopolymer transport protein ExbD